MTSWILRQVFQGSGALQYPLDQHPLLKACCLDYDGNNLTWIGYGSVAADAGVYEPPDKGFMGGVGSVRFLKITRVQAAWYNMMES